MHITVLLGGTSSERDVSIASGLRIADALRSRGHEVLSIDTARKRLDARDEADLARAQIVGTAPPTQEALDRMGRDALGRLANLLPDRGATDVVFLALHGGIGEDGTLQALLDLAGLPYTGSGHLASALAMDKDLSKRLFRSVGVPTPDWLMTPATAEAVQSELGLPVIVKPSREGSTVGLTLVKEESELETAMQAAARYDREVMIERYVPGRELTVGILGEEALPVGEIIPRHEIYDYECKYTPGMAEERFPAEITPDQTTVLQQHALAAFRVLKLSGYARIDFRMTADGQPYCLEANTLPGMTDLSLIPQAAASAGISFPVLCERIALLAVAHEGDRP